MSDHLRIAKKSLTEWVSMDPPSRPPHLADRCTVQAVQDAIAHLGAVTVVSVTLNTSGEFTTPSSGMGLPLPTSVISGLPEFCDVLVEQQTPGGHVAHITVWVPLDWNERFFGVGGGGTRTTLGWLSHPLMRMMTLPTAIRNGFAAAMTDAGNRDPRENEWALDAKTGELDQELIRNWAHRSTHDMTVIGKAVTEAIHGRSPRYSYFQGESGGGRQALAEAQRYPEDYDGIWAADPAVNWTRMIPAGIWPALVMKEHDNPLPPAKLRAFRAAAIAACDGADGLKDGILGPFEPSEFDPRQLVGTQTDAGQITDADADVIREIWDGPRTSTGEWLWYGLRPGTESWGDNVLGMGLCTTAEVDGRLAAVPFYIVESWYRWLLRDPAWDWTTLTFEQFEELFQQAVDEFTEVATDDPDLSRFHHNGGKLIISHGGDDQLILPQGTIHYYQRVQETMGGEEETARFARLFVSAGDGHAFPTPGPGLTLANGVIALMEWVENAKAPDLIIGEGHDLATGQITMTRPAYAYPAVPRYDGLGDPNNASSFTVGTM
jgi:hypothetical protein